MVAAKRYTAEERQALISEFQASGMSANAFCKTQGRPSYPVFSKWIKADNGSVSESTATYDSDLYAQFTETLLPVDPRDKYITFLEDKIKGLEAKLSNLEAK